MTIFASYLGYFCNEARKIEHNHDSGFQEDTNPILLGRGGDGGEQQRHLPDPQAILSRAYEELRGGLLYFRESADLHQYDQLQRVGQ